MKITQKMLALALCLLLGLTFGCSMGQKPGMVKLDAAAPGSPEFAKAAIAGCAFGHEGKPGAAEGLVLAGACLSLICPIASVAMIGAGTAVRSKAASGSGAKYESVASDFDRECLAAMDAALIQAMGNKYVPASDLKHPAEGEAPQEGDASSKTLMADNALDYAIVPKLYYTVNGGMNGAPALVVDWSVLDVNLAEKWKIKTTVFYPGKKDERPSIKNTADPDNAKYYAELAKQSAEDFWLMWNGAQPKYSKQIDR